MNVEKIQDLACDFANDELEFDEDMFYKFLIKLIQTAYDKDVISWDEIREICEYL